MEANESKRVKPTIRKDRISKLSSELVVKILECLPTKNAVGTTILSKRWHKLWTSASHFDFDEGLMFDEHKTFSSGRLFVRFVHHVLRMSLSPTIQRLKLCTLNEIHPAYVRAWIEKAVQKRVKELDLNIFFDEKQHSLPESLYTSESLEVLRIHSFFNMEVPMSSCFTRIKLLHISRDFTADDNVAERLFCSCPVMEELTIDGTIPDESQVVFCINAPMLKRLRINLVETVCDGENFELTEIQITAVNLESIDIEDSFFANYSMVHSPTLLKANVDIGWSYQYEEINEENSSFMILNALSAVRTLQLSAKTSAALDIVQNRSLITFDNMIRLELGVADFFWWKLPSVLLQNMPALDVLVLKKEDKHIDSSTQEIHWTPPESVPNSFLSHLKTIEVTGFEGLNHEVEALKYLLTHAHVLNNATVLHTMPSEKETELQRNFTDFTAALKIGPIMFLRL